MKDSHMLLGGFILKSLKKEKRVYRLVLKAIVMTTIIMLMLFRCTNDNYEEYYKNYEKFTGFQNTETWEFEKYSDIKFIRVPSDIKIIKNEYFLVLTGLDKKIIQIYGLDDGKLLECFGRKGQGPGEFIGACKILYNSSYPDKFWIYDVTQRSLTQYNINSILQHNIYKPDTSIKISSDAGYPLKICCLDSNTYVAIGALKNRLCFYNSKGDTIKTAGYVPGKKDKNITNFVYLQAYKGAIDKNCDVKKIAICNYNSDIVEIYDYNGNILKTIHGPDFFVPKFTPSQHSAIVTSLMCGYFNLCSSSKYIYCTYSGEKADNVRDWTAAFGREIFVFSWDGEPIKRVILNTKLAYTEYCEENNTIYAICYDGEEFFIGYHEL